MLNQKTLFLVFGSTSIWIAASTDNSATGQAFSELGPNVLGCVFSLFRKDRRKYMKMEET